MSVWTSAPDGEEGRGGGASGRVRAGRILGPPHVGAVWRIFTKAAGVVGQEASASLEGGEEANFSVRTSAYALDSLLECTALSAIYRTAREQADIFLSSLAFRQTGRSALAFFVACG